MQTARSKSVGHELNDCIETVTIISFRSVDRLTVLYIFIFFREHCDGAGTLPIAMGVDVEI